MIFVSQNSLNVFLKLLFYVQFYSIHMVIRIGDTLLEVDPTFYRFQFLN